MRDLAEMSTTYSNAVRHQQATSSVGPHLQDLFPDLPTEISTALSCVQDSSPMSSSSIWKVDIVQLLVSTIGEYLLRSLFFAGIAATFSLPASCTQLCCHVLVIHPLLSRGPHIFHSALRRGQDLASTRQARPLSK